MEKSIQPRDTTPAARAVQAGRHHAMSPEERVRLAVQMSEDARLISLQGIADRHPELDERGVVAAYVRMLHGVLPRPTAAM